MPLFHSGVSTRCCCPVLYICDSVVVSRFMFMHFALYFWVILFESSENNVLVISVFIVCASGYVICCQVSLTLISTGFCFPKTKYCNYFLTCWNFQEHFYKISHVRQSYRSGVFLGTLSRMFICFFRPVDILVNGLLSFNFTRSAMGILFHSGFIGNLLIYKHKEISSC